MISNMGDTLLSKTPNLVSEDSTSILVGYMDDYECFDQINYLSRKYVSIPLIVIQEQFIDRISRFIIRYLRLDGWELL